MAGHTTARQQLHRAPCGGRAERAVVAEQARIPTEHQEQAAVYRWVRLSERQHPELQTLFAVPNGSHRNKITAVRLQAEGVRPGVPDLVWLHPSPTGFHGLLIEMKRLKGGRISPEQDAFMLAARSAGYCPVVAYGWREAVSLICQYAGWEEPT